MIRILMWTAIAVLIMSFFGVSIQAVIESPTGQENITYLLGLMKAGIGFIFHSIGFALEWLVRLFT